MKLNTVRLSSNWYCFVIVKTTIMSLYYHDDYNFIYLRRSLVTPVANLAFRPMENFDKLFCQHSRCV